MRRAGAGVVLLGVVYLLGVAEAQAAAQLQVGSGSAAPGSSVVLPVTLVSGAEAIASVSADIAFNLAVFEPSPSCAIAAAVGPGTAADKSLAQGIPSAGLLRVAVLGLNANALPDGEVFSCAFTVRASALPGSYALGALGGAAGPSGMSVAVNAAAGEVTVDGDDGDGIAYDPDLPSCTGGQTSGCSDNCPGVSNADQADGDGDAVGDACDNCTEVANASQLDTDADAIGNRCDCDFTQDQLCTIADFSAFLGDFSAGSDSGSGTDMDGNGLVNISDFSAFLAGFSAGAPGPSASAP